MGNATYFLDDDDDDDYGGDGYGDAGRSFALPGARAPGTGAADLDSGDLVARPRVIRKVRITYARTAKKVDVKKLKDNLWHQLARADDTVRC
jgi:condensin complex subunit 2